MAGEVKPVKWSSFAMLDVRDTPVFGANKCSKCVQLQLLKGDNTEVYKMMRDVEKVFFPRLGSLLEHAFKDKDLKGTQIGG